MKFIVGGYSGNVGMYKIILMFRGGAGKGRVQGGLEEEQAEGNGNKEDRCGQSHFNLLAVCLSSVHDHSSLPYVLKLSS